MLDSMFGTWLHRQQLCQDLHILLTPALILMHLNTRLYLACKQEVCRLLHLISRLSQPSIAL